MSRKKAWPTLVPLPALSPTDEVEGRGGAGDGVIAGVDEVGRGPLAGPVVAAAVILPSPCSVQGIADSKTLPANQREELNELIRAEVVSVGVGWADAAEVDRINILRATFIAMSQAVEALDPSPTCLLVDGNQTIPQLDHIRQVALVKGDNRSLSVAAASIIAKVARDEFMLKVHEDYPMYHFATNMGYGTAAHRDALSRFGPCPLHRRSFRGVIPPESGVDAAAGPVLFRGSCPRGSSGRDL